MATLDSAADRCPKCNVKVTGRMRYCLACYAPLQGPEARRKHLDVVQKIASTHRADPTVVDLPDAREAMRRRRRRRKRLLIGAAVSFVLTAALAMAYLQWNQRQQLDQRRMARQQAAVRELKLLAAGLENFRDDIGRYPTDKEGIESLTDQAKLFQAGNQAAAYQWQGPYVEGRYELDPWGNDYQYRVSGDGQFFELFSNGPEGTGGGKELYISARPAPLHP